MIAFKGGGQIILNLTLAECGIITPFILETNKHIHTRRREREREGIQF